MPPQLTRADSLREYLTGAAADGDPQDEASLSLGGYRSSFEARSYGIFLASALTSIEVDYASGGNAEGNGVLTRLSDNSVMWRDFGGADGASLTLANGETGIVEALDRPGAYLRITRTSASPITGGPCTVTLSGLYNNAFGFPNLSPGEAASGVHHFHATILKNDSPGIVTDIFRWIATLGTRRQSNAGQLGFSGAGALRTNVGNFEDWPETGFCRIQRTNGTLREIVYYDSRTLTQLNVPSTGRELFNTTSSPGTTTDTLDAVPGIAIGLANEGVQAAGSAIELLEDENNEPASITWQTGIIAAEGISIPQLETTEQIGVWVWRQMPPGSKASPSLKNFCVTGFNAA